MHVMDWVETQHEELEIEAAMDWCQLDREKYKPWTKQLMKLKSSWGPTRTLQWGKAC